MSTNKSIKNPKDLSLGGSQNIRGNTHPDVRRFWYRHIFWHPKRSLDAIYGGDASEQCGVRAG